MKILYIFPHPDDESFGPALAMTAQMRAGHEVYLLTLTRGGATKKRFKYNLTVDEMGEVRYREMLEVAKVLDLTGLTVLDLPDSGLKEMNPLELERIIERHIEKIRPDILVSYTVHGISGFHDHLVTHAVVKSAYCRIRQDQDATFLKRLALFTVAESDVPDSKFKLNTSSPEEIDCIVAVDETDIEKSRQALLCYKTYQDVIEEVNVLERIGDKVFFEFFQEEYDPAAPDLTEGLPSGG
ncbi:MAG: PIG-L family deacetylase [Balneolales bacterium]